MFSQHQEPHFSQRNNWLRASVLGANDGLISTASLLMGMVAAKPDFSTLLLTGISALIGGSISMAAGEYVSVSSQSDTEYADLLKEKHELAKNPEAELRELTTIYRHRGLSLELAKQVAIELTAHDALGAHLRDEVGLTEVSTANPVQAALASAGSFCSGAILPLVIALFTPNHWLIPVLATTTLIGLAVLGWFSAKLGGAHPVRPMIRIIIWGAIALLVTGFIGRMIGAAV